MQQLDLDLQGDTPLTVIQTLEWQNGDNTKRIAYTNRNVFLVQVGKGRGSYTTRYSFEGKPFQAIKYYTQINVGNGYKKRLVCWDFKKPIIHKVMT
jgi:beta-glucanase (GH16 family)